MEDKDIMAEVENLINEESKRIAEPTDAQSEGVVIFKNLINVLKLKAMSLMITN